MVLYAVSATPTVVYPVLNPVPNLWSCPLTPISFRIRTYKLCAYYPFRFRTFQTLPETIFRKPCAMCTLQTLEKRGGGGVPILKIQALCELLAQLGGEAL